MRAGPLGLALIACALAARAASAAPATFTFPPGGIIQSVTVSDSTPCAGRPVVVAVTAQHPSISGGAVEIYVDGAPGQPQIVQYFAVNPARKVPIFAITPERIQDRQEITLAVQQCPLVTRSLELLHSRNPYRRDRVDFQAVLRGARARRYLWYFGDGTTTQTNEPFVSHDYSKAMDATRKYSYFSAMVFELGSGLVTARRIAVGSSFALSRSMGFVQADVKTTVTQTGEGFAVGLDIRNHHSTAIVLNRYLKHYLPCDHHAPVRTQVVYATSVLGPSPLIQQPPGMPSPGVVPIAAGQTVRSRLMLPLNQVPPETCAVGFHVMGRTINNRLPVYGSFYLKVRRNEAFIDPVIDTDTLQMLQQLAAQQLLADPDAVTVEQLYLLEQRGFIERTRTGWRRK